MSNQKPETTEPGGYPAEDPAYALAHHIQWAIDALTEAATLLRAGEFLSAHHEIERAMNQTGEAMDAQDRVDALLKAEAADGEV